jgi:hypothetical protein
MPAIIRSTRWVDLDRLRRYLRALESVAHRGATARDPRELLAAAQIIREDAGRDLRRLETGP